MSQSEQDFEREPAFENDRDEFCSGRRHIETQIMVRRHIETQTIVMRYKERHEVCFTGYS